MRIEFRKHFMTGVSYMLPFVVAGGILISLSFMMPNSAVLNRIGRAAFNLMLIALAGYTSYSIADRAGLASGMLAGALSLELGAGYLGALLGGLIAGYVSLAFRRKIVDKVPASLMPICSILLLPLLSVLVVGLLMELIGAPLAQLTALLNDALISAYASWSAILIAVVLGVMMAFDMGGPVNKVAYFFALWTLEGGVRSPVMSAVMIAGMTPPIGLSIATFLFPKKFNAEERESGRIAWFLGLSFVTEGAIPYAASDPLRVIPSLVAGSSAAAAISMAFSCAQLSPHGGIFILPTVENYPFFLLALLVGSVITALLCGSLKKEVSDESAGQPRY
jgi:PTS system fructose-specific IIC component